MISDFVEKPLACWTGKDRYDGKVFDTLTVIFRTAGCSWSRCRMCGYRHERFTDMADGALLRHLRSQLAWVMKTFAADYYQIVKIFTSGSVFDPKEVPAPFLSEIAAAFKGKLIMAETRPEYVDPDVLSRFVETADDGTWKIPLYCAIGLETTNDFIREKCIGKGFTLADFTSAVSVARKTGCGIKAYLLFKPLFLTEEEAVTDIEDSIRLASRFAELISMNPCTVQRKTEMEYYWKRGAYRPPYLWSILSVLAGSPVHVTCDPLGGGKSQGPHNCGKCDPSIVQGIRDYSLNADRDLITALQEISCPCKEEWQYVLKNERACCMPLTR